MPTKPKKKKKKRQTKTLSVLPPAPPMDVQHPIQWAIIRTIQIIRFNQ